MGFKRWAIGTAVLTAAGAAHGTGTRITLSAVTVGDSDSYNRNSNDLTATHAVFATGLYGSSDAGVTVGMGEIHAQTQAVVSGGLAATSQTSVSTGASDTVRATSPNGANVLIRWSLPVTGGGTGTGVGLEDATFRFFTQSFFDNRGVDYRLQISDGTTTENRYYSNGLDQNYVDVTYQSGQDYLIALTFDATIKVNGNDATGAPIASAGTLDFANTAHAYAQVLTPGASLASESGHDYAPVPEPAPLAALGLGALALLRRRRRWAAQEAAFRPRSR